MKTRLIQMNIRIPADLHEDLMQIKGKEIMREGRFNMNELGVQSLRDKVKQVKLYGFGKDESK